MAAAPGASLGPADRSGCTLELTPPPADAPPTVGGERFEVVGFLGEGTRKRVYAARDRDRGGELVAVAVFSTEGMAATAQARARREAEAMAKLGEHPHLVSVLATGQDGERPYVAAEFMPGGDLGDLLASTPQRRLGVERAIAIGADIAAALEHAHGAGIIHRDIKPANVWLQSDLTARLGDFGLATESRARLAVERTLVGTAVYLPPEQAIGRRTDERADLYSLGALLYEMLSGQPPFPGDDPVSIISRHLSAEPVPVSRHVEGVPPELDDLVRRLLAKLPEDRPAGAAEVRAALGRIDPDADGADEGEDNPLDALAAGLFVGRDRESGALRELLDVAVRGNGGVALVEGEPGIGKTRLLEELRTYGRVSGARVLGASCHEADAVPAYWPFAQAIRAYVRDADPVGLAWQLGADGPELARLVPELRDRVPSVGPAEPLAGDEARFRFYEAVAGFLVALARSRPLVLAIDDLHWADSSSIELLRFLAHRVSEAPLLVVCAYRDEEAEARANLRRAIAELSEVPRSERITLGGLERDAIAHYVELSVGSPAPAELIEDIREQTGGNPFFVGEVVRLLATEEGSGAAAPGGGARRVPRGVREAVRRRLERLPAGATEALETAAVVGREFEPELLAEVLDRPLSGELDAARAARILEPGGRGGERYLFAHAVFREALYEALPAARRQQLHQRAGTALEARAGSEPQLPALARHFCEAGPEFGEKARKYSLAAARQAAAQLAHADAAEYLERAVGLLEADDPDALAVRLELGEELTRCGRFADARSMLSAAAAMARERGEPEALATAAIGLGALAEVGRTDDELIALCEEAEAALGELLPAVRARLLAVIATEHYWTDAEGACQEAGARAVELAREAGDDGALAETLAMRQLTYVAEPGTAAIRLGMIEEMLTAARRAGDRRNEARAMAYAVVSHLHNADVAAADRALAAYEALAERLREPRHLWHVPTIRATRAMMEGRFAAARELSREGARLGRLAEEPLSAQYHAIQMGVLNSYAGDPEEMLPVVRRMVADYPALPVWRLALIGFLVDADRHDEARVEYEPVIARGLDSIPRDANWLIGVTRIAEAAARLGDRRNCAELLERLRPFAGEVAIVARAAACNGPVDRYLGMAAAAIGDLDAAIGHHEDALAISERMGDRPIRADLRLQLGQALLLRDRDRDRDRAFDVLSLALADGQELGMRKLVERAVRLRLEAQGFAGVDANASIDSVALAVADERPDLVSFASADGRVTILFSDIENSALMNERLGDARWIEVLREHNTIFRRRLSELGGYEVKNQGDGFMLAFPDPAAALRCAMAVQRDLDARGGPDGERVRVRIGLHVGEVIEEEGDFFGRSVILAARIAAQARGGEVLASAALQAVCSEGFSFDAGRELELKGLGGSHRVFRVEPEEVGVVA